MDQYKIIQETISEFLKKMGFHVDVSPERLDDENISMNIKTNEANFLIGYEGSNLDALQHLLRVVVNKKLGQQAFFLVDINDYRKNKINFLKEFSYNIAKKAKSENVAVTLQPMPAFERRIIHIALANTENIITESTGEGSNRRVVVRANQ